jgi:hypothetical protein
MQAPALFSRPLSIGDLLDWSIRIYRARFGKLILTTAIFFVPLGLLSGVITGQTMTSYLNIFMSAMQNPDFVPNEEMFALAGDDQGLLTTLSLLLTPLSLAATGIVSLALVHQSFGAIRREERPIGGSIKIGWQRFWSWFGMYLLMIVAFIGVGILLFILFAIAAITLVALFGSLGSFSPSTFESNGSATTVGVIVAIICFYGLFLIALFGPFIYLYARWAVAIPGIVDQSWGALEALQESWALTRGHVWRCIGYNLLLYLLYGIIYVALMVLGFGLSAFVLTTSTLASVIVFALIGAILPVLWQPLQMAAQVMLYYDLRMRNESYDLELRIDQLEAEVGRNAPTPL